MTEQRIRRPSRGDLEAAVGKVLPDVIAPGLSVLFCGINPGLYSAAVGCHFARPGNRFWPALHRSGFTPRLFDPSEQWSLLGLGLGVTNLVDRATAGAAELEAAELREGGERLLEKVGRYRPAWVAFLGLGAYRKAFASRHGGVGEAPARVGEGPPLGRTTRAWVLPNPSGINAHYQPDRLAAAFAALREAAVAKQPSRSCVRNRRVARGNCAGRRCAASAGRFDVGRRHGPGGAVPPSCGLGCWPGRP
jgi:double-stranded uracil-DNA glycosylase